MFRVLRLFLQSEFLLPGYGRSLGRRNGRSWCLRHLSFIFGNEVICMVDDGCWLPSRLGVALPLNVVLRDAIAYALADDALDFVALVVRGFRRRLYPPLERSSIINGGVQNLAHRIIPATKRSGVVKLVSRYSTSRRFSTLRLLST